MKKIPEVPRPSRAPRPLIREFSRSAGSGLLNDYGKATPQEVNKIRQAHPTHEVLALPADPSCKTGE